MPLTRSRVVGVFHPASDHLTKPSASRLTIALPCNQTVLPSVVVLPTVLASPRSNACLICCVTFYAFVATIQHNKPLVFIKNIMLKEMMAAQLNGNKNNNKNENYENDYNNRKREIITRK